MTSSGRNNWHNYLKTLLRTSRRLVEARNSEAEKKPNGTTAGWILVNRATKSKDQL